MLSAPTKHANWVTYATWQKKKWKIDLGWLWCYKNRAYVSPLKQIQRLGFRKPLQSFDIILSRNGKRDKFSWFTRKQMQVSKNLNLSCLFRYVSFLPTELPQCSFKLCITPHLCLQAHVASILNYQENDTWGSMVVLVLWSYQPSWRLRDTEEAKNGDSTWDESWNQGIIFR